MDTMKVILLTTSEKTKLFYRPSDKKLIKTSPDFTHNFEHLRGVYVYFVSADDIEEGDYVITDRNQIVKVDNSDMLTSEEYIHIGNAKQIVASTNKYIGVPPISRDFLENYVKEYNKGNIIKESLCFIKDNQR